MQVLKNDIKNNIKNAAVYEFKIHGYEKASIRNIAKRADVSVGNLYRYFSNKENLFDYIVSPIYEKIVDNHFDDSVKYDADLININFLEEEELIGYFLKMHKSYRDESYLLLLRSQGTKYEKTKEKLVTMIEHWFNNFFKATINKDKVIIKGNLLSKALATSIIEGLCTILIEAKDDQEFLENMIQFIELTFRNAIRSVINIKGEKVKYRRESYEEIINRFSNHCDHSNYSNTKNHQ